MKKEVSSIVYTFPYLYYDYEKYSNDPLNLYGARTLKNSNKRVYNCGGYALGTFNWYLPAATLEDFNECMECLDEKSLLEQFTSNILEEFLNLERIDFSDIPKVKDIIIGFAVKERDDFHFIRRGRNFQWYHKR